jgi:hypothetical protein
VALINLGNVARKQGEKEQAVSLYNDALTLHRKPENERGVAHALRVSLAFSKALDGLGGPNK